MSTGYEYWQALAEVAQQSIAERKVEVPQNLSLRSYVDTTCAYLDQVNGHVAGTFDGLTKEIEQVRDEAHEGIERAKGIVRGTLGLAETAIAGREAVSPFLNELRARAAKLVSGT